MENASKALLIAAGMFLTVLLVSLLVTFYGQISDFYANEHKNAMIEQAQEFNARFENYKDKTIRGNELISIMNRIIDYNNLQADMTGYERIIIDIDLLGHANDLAYDGDATLFDNKISNKNNDNAIRAISELSVKLTASASGIPEITEAKLQRLSAEIDNIVYEDADEMYKANRAQKLTKILGYTVDKNGKSEKHNVNILSAVKKATREYYQLTQFKRVMFKCEEVTYDVDSARVNGMIFVAIETDDGHLKSE